MTRQQLTEQGTKLNVLLSLDGVLSSDSGDPIRAGVMLYYALNINNRVAIRTSRKKEDAEHWLHSHGIINYDDLIDYSSASQRENEESIEAKSSSFESMVFSTVVGTGMLLWVVQGAQLAATLISVAPAWMQLDPLAVLNNADGKMKKEELTAGEKLFD